MSRRNHSEAVSRTHYMRHDNDALRTSPYRLGSTATPSQPAASAHTGNAAQGHFHRTLSNASSVASSALTGNNHSVAGHIPSRTGSVPPTGSSSAYRDPSNTFYAQVDNQHHGFGESTGYTLPGARMAQRVSVRQQRDLSRSRGRSDENHGFTRAASPNLPPPPPPIPTKDFPHYYPNQYSATGRLNGQGEEQGVMRQKGFMDNYVSTPKATHRSTKPTISAATPITSHYSVPAAAFPVPPSAVSHPAIVAQLQQWAAKYAQQVLDTQTRELREALRQAYERVDSLTTKNQKLAAQQQSRLLTSGGHHHGAAGGNTSSPYHSIYSYDILSMNGVEISIATARLRTRHRRTTTVMSEDVRPNSTVTLVFPEGCLSIQLEVVQPIDASSVDSNHDTKLVSMAEDVSRVTLLEDYVGSHGPSGGGANYPSTSLYSSYNTAHRSATLASNESSCAVEIVLYDKEVSEAGGGEHFGERSNGLRADGESVQVRLVLRGPSDTATEELYRGISSLLDVSRHRRGALGQTPRDMRSGAIVPSSHQRQNQLTSTLDNEESANTFLASTVAPSASTVGVRVPRNTVDHAKGTIQQSSTRQIDDRQPHHQPKSIPHIAGMNLDDDTVLLKAVDALTEGISVGGSRLSGAVLPTSEATVSPLRRQLSPMSQVSSMSPDQYRSAGRGGVDIKPTSPYRSGRHDNNGGQTTTSSLLIASVSPTRSPSAPRRLPVEGSRFSSESLQRARSVEEEEFINNAWERVFGSSKVARTSSGLFEGKTYQNAHKAPPATVVRQLSAADATFALSLGGGDNMTTTGSQVRFNGGGAIDFAKVSAAAPSVTQQNSNLTSAAPQKPLPTVPVDANDRYGAPIRTQPPALTSTPMAAKTSPATDFASPGDDMAPFTANNTNKPSAASIQGSNEPSGGVDKPPPPPPPPPAKKAPPPPPPKKSAPPPPTTTNPPAEANDLPSPPPSAPPPPGKAPPPPPPPGKKVPPPPPPKKAPPPPPQ